ncbi:hypothetical protein I2F27_06615 [Acinetobacter sp. B5B]|uniref:hypothetical protein n=1 Tax=Acinetobacter baretiae TaxID=2605383 RepID=UPI0018C28B1F|nr:hypothetical protein [Acinetobacter baretiae]MBF7682998.1 hypothetical protein [Acinetobacter baretiae]
MNTKEFDVVFDHVKASVADVDTAFLEHEKLKPVCKEVYQQALIKSQQEVDDLKQQLKEVHDSRISFVEYHRDLEGILA